MRGHHWIIENCTIDWSNAVGIDIGNECWHHDILPDQQIGYTIIRECHIKDVGVCGIAGLFAEHVLDRGQFNRRNRMAENGIVLGSCGYKTA